MNVLACGRVWNFDSLVCYFQESSRRYCIWPQTRAKYMYSQKRDECVSACVWNVTHPCVLLPKILSPLLHMAANSFAMYNLFAKTKKWTCWRVCISYDSLLYVLDSLVYVLDSWVYVLDSLVYVLDSLVYVLDSLVYVLDSLVHVLDSLVYVTSKNSLTAIAYGHELVRKVIIDFFEKINVLACVNCDSFASVISKNLRAAIPYGRKLVRKVQINVFAKKTWMCLHVCESWLIHKCYCQESSRCYSMWSQTRSWDSNKVICQNKCECECVCASIPYSCELVRKVRNILGCKNTNECVWVCVNHDSFVSVMTHS